MCSRKAIQRGDSGTIWSNAISRVDGLSAMDESVGASAAFTAASLAGAELGESQYNIDDEYDRNPLVSRCIET